MSSEPRRWKDSPDAPIGMRELLGSARPTRTLDEHTFRRNAARVAKLSVAPAAAAATISIWTKLAAAGAIGLAATGAVVAVELREMQPAPAPTAQARTAPSAQPVAPSPVQAEPAKQETPESVPAPAAPAPVRVAPAPAHSDSPSVAPSVPSVAADEKPAALAPPAKTSSLASELLLLEDARAYASRDPSVALARLAEHRERFPSGVMAAERDLMELDLLRRTGRVQDARTRANAWLARDPNGMHSARVREILASLGP